MRLTYVLDQTLDAYVQALARSRRWSFAIGGFVANSSFIDHELGGMTVALDFSRKERSADPMMDSVLGIQ
jgi:hypothetical protein